MINVNDIRGGMTIKIDHNIYIVLESQHVKPGKGPAFVRTKLKNIRSQVTTEQTFNTSVKFESAVINKQVMQYLYNESDVYHFMNTETYDQLEVSKDVLAEKVNYLKEGLIVQLEMYESEIIAVTLPDKIALKVVSTEPATRGNTTSSATKEATFETGYTTRVPIFIEEGEELLISTVDGKYSSRA